MSEDAYLSWKLGIATLREINIRRGQILPRPDMPDEQRWAKEGDVPVARLETVRTGT